MYNTEKEEKKVTSCEQQNQLKCDRKWKEKNKHTTQYTARQIEYISIHFSFVYT